MPSLFEQDIRSQPQVIAMLLERTRRHAKHLAAWIRRKAPTFVMIAARGTSDNAATFAKYVFGGLNGVPVALAAPSLFTRYATPPQVAAGLVIGISQSGRGEDVHAVLESARTQGAATLAITNDPDSPLAETAEETLLLHAGEERSVAASKTYTASLTAVASLAAHWAGSAKAVRALEGLPGWIQTTLGFEAEVDALLEQVADSDGLVVSGRGYNYATVLEIALKIKELAYFAAEGYSAADFRHGPIARLDEGFPVVAIVPRGPSFSDMAQFCDEVLATRAALSVISNDAMVRRKGVRSVPLPDDLPEWLSPIVAVVPGQLLALKLALHLGEDPDHPRRLSKVTVTR